MSLPVPVWYDSTGTTVVTRLTFDPVSGGVPTAWQTVRLYNAKGNAFAGTLRGISIYALTRDFGDTANGYQADHRAAVQSWLEVEFTGAVGGTAVAQATAITKVGSLRRIYCNEIPADSYRTVNVRLAPPPGAGTVHVEVLLEVDYDRPAVPVSQGFAEAGLSGVELGYGDASVSYVAQGGACTASGPADNKVNVANVLWIYKGIPYSKLAHQVTLDGNDSAAAALAAGQAYWATLSLKDGTVTTTKSVKGAAPLAESLKPAVPAGEAFLAYVHRDFDAAIATGDIRQEAFLRGLYDFTSSGLTGYLGTGSGLVDNLRIRHDFQSPVTLTASSSGAACNRIWAVPSEGNGGFEVTQSTTKPQPLAELLYDVDTDGSGVTAVRDRRRFLPEPTDIPLTFAAVLVLNNYSLMADLPRERRWFLIPVNPVRAFIDDDGTGAASGSHKFDVFRSVDGAAEATIYTSSGTNDQRPAIAYNEATLRDVDSLPEVLELSAYSQLRAKYVAQPGSISVLPAGARVHLLAVSGGS